MERLKGKTIIIGKNPQQSNLLISVVGMPKTGMAGMPQSVPNSVSRCIPAEGVGHAKIEVDQNGNMTLTNMKSMNVTYVNGSEIASKRITDTSTIELGKDRHPVNLNLIIETAKKIIGVNPKGTHDKQNQPVKKFNISHLHYVWHDYHAFTVNLQKKQKNQGNMQRIPMFFTMGGGVISSLAIALEWDPAIRYMCIGLTVIGLILMAVLFVKNKQDTTLEDKERAMEEFQDRYVCPNPECGKFLGNHSYKFMKKQYSMHCPYCKCEFVEN